MHRSRAPLRGQGVFSAAQFSAGYITNMPAFDLRQTQQAIWTAIDDYAELETGNREYFWNRPHSIG